MTLSSSLQGQDSPRTPSPAPPPGPAPSSASQLHGGSSWNQLQNSGGPGELYGWAEGRCGTLLGSRKPTYKGPPTAPLTYKLEIVCPCPQTASASWPRPERARLELRSTTWPEGGPDQDFATVIPEYQADLGSPVWAPPPPPPMWASAHHHLWPLPHIPQIGFFPWHPAPPVSTHEGQIEPQLHHASKVTAKIDRYI